MSYILQHFYNVHMLSDDIVLDWIEEPSKKIPKEISQEIRKESQKFIKWLENAAEDESDN